jgi:ABC-type lipopolysaccharide export system ATPase subunit
MSVFDDLWGFIDPFSSSDIEEIFAVLIAILIGYLVLEKGVDNLLSF